MDAILRKIAAALAARHVPESGHSARNFSAAAAAAFFTAEIVTPEGYAPTAAARSQNVGNFRKTLQIDGILRMWADHKFRLMMKIDTRYGPNSFCGLIFALDAIHSKWSTIMGVD